MSGYDPKYDRLIDAEIWAFIAETESHYPPDAIDMTIEGQRAVYNRMCKAFHAGHPAGVRVEDSVIAGSQPIPVRRYTSGGGVARVVYLHGGGFVVGGLDSHDDVCAEICAATGFDVTAVDYRLSPEHPFPEDFNDALAATQHEAAQGLPLVLVGDSAGGNLCAAVAAAQRTAAHPPIGQVLIYPGLGAPTHSQSAVEHAVAPMLTAQDSAFYAAIRSANNTQTTHNPSFSPLRATDFENLPPTIAITAQCDPLSSDGMLYCAQINAGGGMARHIEEQGLVHGYLRARHQSRRAGASFARILMAISALGKGEWPEDL